MKKTNTGLKKLWYELQELEDVYGGPVALFFAFVLLIAVGIPTARDVLVFWKEIEQGQRAQVGIVLLQTIATLIGGIAIFWNIVLSRKQIMVAQKQMRISQEQLITEMFSRAIEQLGHEQNSVRIGAIYSLERIARESVEDNCSVIEIISSYVRDRCHVNFEDSSQRGSLPGKDIQAAITVLGRRDINKRANPISLANSDLRRIEFCSGNFEGSKLACSDLSKADFFKADLRCSDLYRAKLREAKLVKADLRGADLGEADLSNADLDQADLREVKYLKVEQVKEAKNWDKAIYDPKFADFLEIRIMPE